MRTRLVGQIRLLILIILMVGCSSREPVMVEEEPPLQGDKLALAWTYQAGGPINTSPLPVGRAVLVGPVGGPMRLYALAAKDGALRWAYESEDGFVKALYATDSVVSYIAYQDFANGLDAQAGTLLWRKDTGNWVPSLAGAGEVVYFGSANTVVHALDMNTGEPLWKYNIGGDTFNYMLGAPVRVSDNLYFLTQRGDIIALNATDGTLLWQKETGVTGSRDGFSVAKGWIFFGDGQGNVYAYTSSKQGS